LTAAAMNPDLPMVYEALGNIRLFRRQHDEAVAAATKWVEIEPGNADAYANLAGALQLSGAPERTAPLIERAMLLNPFYPFYYILYRGQAYFTMERYEEAIEALRRSATQNPEALPTHLYLAACLAHMGKVEDAREALAEVVRLYPGFSIEFVRRIFVYKNAADQDRLVDGLGMAGLTE
jgi:adenylate cyclase